MAKRDGTPEIELLAPARDLDCGRAAIGAGADAIYLGAPRFGARRAAAFSLDDLATLVAEAHLFRIKVLVALNTLLHDEELAEAIELAEALCELGVDALIIQDVGLLERALPPLPLHASTQMHNSSVERVRFLEQVGFARVVLARELGLQQIAAIRQQCDIDLECFVHGALCVSYSGQCYLSYAQGRRSGNRGDCAQPCRKRYRLEDAAGESLGPPRHYLSLRDLDRSSELGALIDAGVSSFKIEGRLKDARYVKNTVGFYCLALDREIALRGLRRASSGRCALDFEPKLDKTFNRGFTRYFLRDDEPRDRKVGAHKSPKSIGEAVGQVKRVGQGELEVATLPGIVLHNGDGLVFFDRSQSLCGLRVERAEGRVCQVRDTAGLAVGMDLYRNRDPHFDKILDGAKLARRIGMTIEIARRDDALECVAEDEDGHRVELSHAIASDAELPRDREAAEARLRKQLGKLGSSPFVAESITLASELPFLPLAEQNELRRRLAAALQQERLLAYPLLRVERREAGEARVAAQLDYRANVLNTAAERFYRRHGAEEVERTAESGIPLVGRAVMRTRYCLRREIGRCPYPRGPEGRPDAESLFLIDEAEGKETRLRVDFDCEACEMVVRWQGQTRPSR